MYPDRIDLEKYGHSSAVNAAVLVVIRQKLPEARCQLVFVLVSSLELIVPQSVVV